MLAGSGKRSWAVLCMVTLVFFFLNVLASIKWVSISEQLYWEMGSGSSGTGDGGGGGGAD